MREDRDHARASGKTAAGQSDPKTSGRPLNWLSISGNIALGAALLLAIYLLLDRFILNSAPAGTCPLITSRPLLYLAIGLCAVSLVLSFFEKKPDI